MTRNQAFHPLTLTFADKRLEQALSATGLERTRHQGRIAMMLGIFLYLLAGILDRWLVPPEHAAQVWTIRLAAVCVPICVMVLSFTPWFARLCHSLLAGVGLAAGVGLICMQLFLPIENTAYFYPVMVLVTFYTYNFIGTRFIHALAVDLALLAAYNLIFGGLMDYPAHILVSHDFFIISANLIGGSAGYLAERQRRLLFLRERELEEANLSKGRLFAAASHDLRQPIHAMVLFLDALQGVEDRSERARLVGSIKTALNALKELLETLLDISKLDAGAIEPKHAVIDVRDIFVEIDETFSSLAASRGLRFKLWFPTRTTHLFTDRRLLLSVLNNLVGNALKNTRRGGVLVALRPRDDGMVFQVWDTGIGIAAGHVERIFDEYYQVGNQERDRAKGMGLGLAIARRICGLLGLSLDCRSRPDIGSLFEVRLPAHAVAPTAASPDVVGETPQIDCAAFRGKNIVLVEDDPLVAAALGDALGVHGVDIHIFNSAEAALGHPSIRHADSFIVDHQLAGGMDGLDFLREASRLRGQPVKAVMISGNTSGEFVGSVRELNWPLLFKPVDSRQILSALAD